MDKTFKKKPPTQLSDEKSAKDEDFYILFTSMQSAMEFRKKFKK